MNRSLEPLSVLPERVVRLTAILAVLIVISVQILTTLHIGQTPIRIALSDLLIPFALLPVLLLVFYNRKLRPDWVLPGFDYLLLAFLIWLTISAALGYFRTGEFIAWAWGPKLIGFGVLLCYLCLGIALSQTGRDQRDLVMKIFVVTGWGIALYSVVLHWFETNGIHLFGTYIARPVGLSANPNAYSFLAANLLAVQIFYFQKSRILRWTADTIGLSLLVSVIVLTGSRSVYLGLICVVPVFLIFFRMLDWKKIVFSICLAFCICYAASIHIEQSASPDSGTVLDSVTVKDLYTSRNIARADAAIKARVNTSRMAIELWRQHPIEGVGLGGFLHHYKEATDGKLFTLHTSGLWLLVETGLVGFILFGSAFGLTLIVQFRRALSTGAPLSVMVCGVLLLAAGTSIGTEVIYQRFFWLLVGVASVYPGCWSSGSRDQARPQAEQPAET